MNEEKGILKKIVEFIKCYKLPVVVSTIIIIITVSGIIYSIILSKNYQKENYTYIKIKSIEDLTEVEKEILGTENKDNESKEDKKNEINYSEEYKEYEKLSEEEKEKLEVVPRKEEITIDEMEEIKEDIDYKKEEVIPSSYNLKDHINIKVENQGSYGLCWDFASLKSLETNLLLHEGKDLDLSELHLDYYESDLMYGIRTIHEGGNFSDFVKYSLLTGAVLEKDVPYAKETKSILGGKEYKYITQNEYSEEEYIKFTKIKSVARATEVIDFPSVRKTNGIVENLNDEELIEFRNVIKSHIIKNGSLYTVMASPTETNTYCDEDCLGNHAVSIVGWDDNYSKDNFKSKNGKKPIHDGAYIILNSWGEKYGDKGYYYVSYDDKLIETQISGVVSSSMNDAIKMNDIKNPLVKNIINEKLNNYIFNYNNEKYITKIALNKIENIKLANKNITSKDLDGLEIFDNVNEIDLSNNEITDVSILNKFKNLQIINLSNNKIKDVSALKNLKVYSIDLSGNLNVDGYQYLNNVKELSLKDANITTLNDLSNLNDLYSLNLSNNEELDYNKLFLPKDISELYLDNTNIKKYDFSIYKKLIYLSLKNNHLKNVKMLKGNNNVYRLDLSNNEMNDFSKINDFFIKKNEKEVNFDGSNLILNSNNISDISIINDIKISQLDLSDNKITDISNYNNKIALMKLNNNKIKKGFNTLKDSRIVYLNNCDISDFEKISEIKNVLELYLDDNNISNLKGISNLVSLTTLSLSNNKIEDIKEISNAENLIYLNLDNNKIVDITPLNELKNLRTLSMAGNKNTKGKLNGNIIYLNVNDCDMNINTDLNELKNLSYINITNNKINDLFEIIKNNGDNFLIIVAENLSLSEEEYQKLLENQRFVELMGVNVNIKLKIDSNNNINLENKNNIRKILMKSVEKEMLIENATMDNKFEYIHVIDPKIKNVSIKINEIYSKKTINISF